MKEDREVCSLSHTKVENVLVDFFWTCASHRRARRSWTQSSFCDDGEHSQHIRTDMLLGAHTHILQRSTIHTHTRAFCHCECIISTNTENKLNTQVCTFWYCMSHATKYTPNVANTERRDKDEHVVRKSSHSHPKLDRAELKGRAHQTGQTFTGFPQRVHPSWSTSWLWSSSAPPSTPGPWTTLGPLRTPWDYSGLQSHSKSPVQMILCHQIDLTRCEIQRDRGPDKLSCDACSRTCLASPPPPVWALRAGWTTGRESSTGHHHKQTIGTQARNRSELWGKTTPTRAGYRKFLSSFWLLWGFFSICSFGTTDKHLLSCVKVDRSIQWKEAAEMFYVHYLALICCVLG